MKDRTVHLVLITAMCLGGAVFAGVDFEDPAGGWSYIYTGDDDTAGDNFTSLDATWDHANGSDQWDGSRIGEGRPGGAVALTEDGIGFLRIQDTGDPRDHGMGDPGSNRKVYLGHSITNDIGAGVAGTLLDDGVTISFRARLATGGTLDQIHPDNGGDLSNVPATGDGYVLHDGGKGCFGIRQATGDKNISFALAVASDDDDVTESGLVMNKLNGTSPSGDVDLQGETGGNLNFLALDPTVWHEFWITIAADTTGTGTHEVTVYMDGSEEPAGEFVLTAGSGNDYGDTYIAMGAGATPQSGAFDIDFYAYTPGVIAAVKAGRPRVAIEGADFYQFFEEDGEVSLDLSAVVDDDGLPDPPAAVTLAWSAEGPSAVSFDPVDQASTTATLSGAGVYTLTLSADDGEEVGTDSVKVIVVGDMEPMAHWNFELVDEPNSILDAVNNNVGIIVKGETDPNLSPELTEGWIGDNAMTFPGDGKVRVVNDRTIDPNFFNAPEYGATVSAWIKVDAFNATPWATVVSKGDSAWRLMRQGGGDTMAFHVNTAGGQASANGSMAVNDGLWHHVVGVYGLGGASIYVDGVLDGFVESTTAMNVSPLDAVEIGGRFGRDDRDWFGLIDDVQVFAFAMREEHVRTLSAMGELAPFVDAGQDQTAKLKPGETVDLDGIAVDYGKSGPVPVTSLWTTESGPADAIFGNENLAATTVSFPAFGTYLLRLTAEDGYAIVYDEVEIEVISPTCEDVADEDRLVGDISGPEGVPDCRVDLIDFAVMALDWMICNDPSKVGCEDPYENGI